VQFVNTHHMVCKNTHLFEKHALRCVNLATSGKREKHTLRRVFFTHLYLANTHLKVCKNTHLFRKIHTLSCVKKHALRCVNLATEGVLKIHTLFFRVSFSKTSNYTSPIWSSLRNSHVHVFPKLHEKPYYYLYK
jgi:hypothetical protein